MKQQLFLIFLLHATIRIGEYNLKQGGVDALQSKKKGRPSMKKEYNKTTKTNTS